MLEIKEKEIEDILIEEGIINISQLKDAWSHNISLNKSILDVMLDLGLISEKQSTFAKAKKLEVDFLDLVGYKFEDKNVPIIISENIARKYCSIPLKIDGNTLLIAMKDTNDLYALDDFAMCTQYKIKPIMSYEKDIETLIDSVFNKTDEVVGNDVLMNEEELASLDKEKIQKIIDMLNEKNSPIFKGKLGGILVNSGIISKDNLDIALKIQENIGDKLGTVLVREGFVTQDVLYKFLEAQLNTQFIDINALEIPVNIVQIVKENLARKYNLIPVELDGDILKVAMSDPSDVFAVDDLRLSTGMEIVPLLAYEELILERINFYYKKKQNVKQVAQPDIKEEQAISTNGLSLELELENNFDEEIKRVNEEIAIEINLVQQEEDFNDLSEVSNAPIVKMVNIIFQKAIVKRASDIHIEPYEDCIIVRYRVDGQLIEMMKHDKKILSSLVARIKIISSLNIAEKRIPQDGRITITVNKKNYDMRVSILPTIHGEKVVIRIADKDAFNVSKKDLGLYDDDLEKFDDIMDNPHGIVLVTGPTGSGKSTTLYTSLRELSKPNVNILTVEDPVECSIRGINQIQVNTKAGLTFSSALRAFLRQDPDIIMVGEIRDGETAEIATRAAITGHLVLSTLHTNDAASSITRIIDMGIEPFIISSCIVGVIAQRLVRRLCPVCKKEHTLDENEKLLLQIEPEEEVKIYEPKGCSSCSDSGYKGRIAIYEIMNITRQHREMIAKNVTSDTLKDLSVSLGMKTLRDSCMRVVKDGTTSMDEMLRVTYSKD